MDQGILIAVLFGVLAIAIVSTMWTAIRGAPWAPTPWATVHEMLAVARVQPGDVVYDAGSGDGRVLIAAARRFGARAVGIEIDPLRYVWTRLLVMVLGLRPQVCVIRGDLFYQDLSQADVVTVCLRPDTNHNLVSKLRREMRPGARVVSYSFAIPGWPLAGSDERRQVFLYRADGQPGDSA